MKQKLFRQTQRSAGAKLLAPIANSDHTRTDVHPSREEVARMAYLIYMEQGCLHGHDVQHWLEAEAQTLATAAPRTRAS